MSALEGADGAAVDVAVEVAARERYVSEHAGHESMHSAMFFILIFGMIAFQIALHFWKARAFASYQLVTLIGLWLFPFGISLLFGYWRMIAIWTAFSTVTLWLIVQATRKPLAQRTPRRIYTWFSAFYRLSFAVGLFGYALVMAEFFGLTHLITASHSLAQAGAVLLFFGTYYGVLSRDAAEVCTSRMASTMGMKTCKDDGLPSRRLNPNMCGICGLELDEGDGGERTFTLSCRHKYHEFCIRGWTIIGKKDVCPFCAERVNLRETFTNPWEAQSLLWANLLDAVRYLIVWNPFIVLAIQAVFYLLDMR